VGILILLLGICVALSTTGHLFPDFQRWEWFLGFPVMVCTFLLFMSKAEWMHAHAEETDEDLLRFVAFLEQPPKKLKEIAGDKRALSVLLPYAIASGTERNIIDIYCAGKRKVELPSWFMIYGNTTEEVHVQEAKSVLADFVEGMLDAF
jgi:hypothetical protein